MEEATELANYLPLSFKTESEQKYIEFLWDVFETNYTSEKYQLQRTALCVAAETRR